MAQTNRKQMLGELGVTGLSHWGGIIDEEFDPNLKGIRGKRLYKEMVYQDPVARAMIFSIEQAVRRSEFVVQPAGEDPQAEERADFVKGCLDDMSSSFEDHLSELSTMFTFGYSIFELCYKERKGRRGDHLSRFDDGKVGWRKFAFRAQDTVEFKLDPEGGLEGVIQTTLGKGQVTIPMEKALLYRTQIIKGNPEGFSLLRPAYFPYYARKKIQIAEGIGVQNDLAGLPVLYTPQGVNPEQDSDAWSTARKMVQNIRRGEYEGILLPGPKASTVEAWQAGGYLLEAYSGGGGRQFDTGGILSRYAREMAMAVLMQWLFLGSEGAGSRALADTQGDFFLLALDGWLQSIASVLNRFAIPRLFALNGYDGPGYPVLVPSQPRRHNLQELAAYVVALTGVGLDMRDLEPFFRAAAGLPGKPEAEKAEKQMDPRDYLNPEEALEGSEVEPEDVARERERLEELLALVEEKGGFAQAIAALRTKANE